MLYIIKSLNVKLLSGSRNESNVHISDFLFSGFFWNFVNARQIQLKIQSHHYIFIIKTLNF